MIRKANANEEDTEERLRGGGREKRNEKVSIKSIKSWHIVSFPGGDVDSCKGICMSQCTH